MIIQLLVDCSRDSKLRQALAENPVSVLDQYQIPETERDGILSGDREVIARQLHAEIDQTLRESKDIIWPADYPVILFEKPQEAPAQQPVTLEVTVKNAAPSIHVKFRRPGTEVEANILDIDQSLRGGLATLQCRASFPQRGRYDLEVINLVDGQELISRRPNVFTAT